MESRANRPHFVRSTTRQKTVLANNKHKMMILILRKISIKQLKKYFYILKQSRKETDLAIKIIRDKSEKNINKCKQISWNKLICNSRHKQKQLKSLQRAQKLQVNLYKKLISKAFLKITRYGYQKQRKQIKKLINHRNKHLITIICKIQARKKSQGFRQIIMYKNYQQKIMTSLKGLRKMFKERQQKEKLRVWAKMCRSSVAQQKDIQYELGQVMKQVDTLRRQLVQKVQQNQDLQTKLLIRQQNTRFKTISDIETNGRGSARSVDVKKSSSIEKRKSYSNQKDDKKSDTGSQHSVLSWINNSFLSFKSGKSSRAMSGVQCFCVYREKYNQYKYQSISLKNQLQIIKNQLQVTKDVNQHLQQQISNFYGSQDNSYELERINKQNKQLRKERDALKQKMYKYQKYVAGLKVEFKNKIESLYRNIKKNQ